MSTGLSDAGSGAAVVGTGQDSGSGSGALLGGTGIASAAKAGALSCITGTAAASMGAGAILMSCGVVASAAGTVGGHRVSRGVPVVWLNWCGVVCRVSQALVFFFLKSSVLL